MSDRIKPFLNLLRVLAYYDGPYADSHEVVALHSAPEFAPLFTGSLSANGSELFPVPSMVTLRSADNRAIFTSQLGLCELQLLSEEAPDDIVADVSEACDYALKVFRALRLGTSERPLTRIGLVAQFSVPLEEAVIKVMGNIRNAPQMPDVQIVEAETRIVTRINVLGHPTNYWIQSAASTNYEVDDQGHTMLKPVPTMMVSIDLNTRPEAMPGAFIEDAHWEGTYRAFAVKLSEGLVQAVGL